MEALVAVSVAESTSQMAPDGSPFDTPQSPARMRSATTAMPRAQPFEKTGSPDDASTVVPPEIIPAPPILELALVPPVLALALVPPLAREPAMADAPPLGRDELVREAVIEAPPEGIAEAPPEGVAEAPPEETTVALAPPAAPAALDVLDVPPEGVAASLSSMVVIVISERIPHPANSRAMMDATRRERVLLGMDGLCPFAV